MLAKQLINTTKYYALLIDNDRDMCDFVLIGNHTCREEATNKFMARYNTKSYWNATIVSDNQRRLLLQSTQL